MRKFKQKEIKAFIQDGIAKKLDGTFEEILDFIHTHNFERIGYSAGVYGLNGGIIRDMESGELYAIPARNSTLFMIF